MSQVGYQGCQVVFKLIESFYDDANFCNAAMLLLLIIVVLMIVMLLIIVAEESGLLEDANLIFVHFGTLALFRPVKSTVKLKSAYICNKIAKEAKILRSLCKKVH